MTPNPNEASELAKVDAAMTLLNRMQDGLIECERGTACIRCELDWNVRDLLVNYRALLDRRATDEGCTCELTDSDVFPHKCKFCRDKEPRSAAPDGEACTHCRGYGNDDSYTCPHCNGNGKEPPVSDASSATSEAVAWYASDVIQDDNGQTFIATVAHVPVNDAVPGCLHYEDAVYQVLGVDEQECADNLQTLMLALTTHPAQQQRQPQGDWVVDDAMIDRFDAAYRRGYDKAAEIPNATLSDMKIAGFTAGLDAIAASTQNHVDAKDAARYRWLKRHRNSVNVFTLDERRESDEWDAEIDELIGKGANIEQG